LAVDGFHRTIDPYDVLYVGMSRARDKLVVVSTAENIRLVQGLETKEQE
jgi:ATP-dependent exoDNAse (exonuclease V) alpha subunit